MKEKQKKGIEKELKESIGKPEFIAMIHTQASPGTPKNSMAADEIIEKAVQEAQIYKKNGIETVAIENMHDVPYTKQIRPEITALMAVIGNEVKKLGLECGIQILAGGNKEALAVAKAAGLDFIRAEGFVFGHIGDEGYFDSCAGELLRYRKQIGADNVKVYTDIKKKHSSHAVTSDISLKETAEAAKFFLSDGIIITGASTGMPASIEDLKEVKEIGIPVLIGSGITDQNLRQYWDYADRFIIGSYFKKNGHWANELDEERIKRLMDIYNSLKC